MSLMSHRLEAVQIPQEPDQQELEVNLSCFSAHGGPMISRNRMEEFEANNGILSVKMS